MCRKLYLLVSVVLVVGLVNGSASGALVELLKVDLGNRDQQVEEGFTEISGNGENYHPEPYIIPNVGGTAIDVNLMTTVPKTPEYRDDLLGFRNPGSFHPLYQDLLHVNDYDDFGITVTFSDIEPGVYSLEVNEDDDALTFIVRDVNGNIHDLDSTNTLPHDQWVHVAGTYDGNEMKSYVNGRLELSAAIGPIPLSQDTTDLGIGNRPDANDRVFEGAVDDVRVYDYALTETQVAYIATDGTGYVPLISDKDLFDKEAPGRQAVNFRDLDMLLDNWLDEQLWPE